MNNNYKKIKNSKPFKLFDLLIYLIIALLITISILTFSLINKNNGLSSIEVFYNNSFIFSYDFISDKYESDDFNGKTEISDNNESITVTFIFYNNNNEYNVLFIDKKAVTANVIDANCSIRKDCVHAKMISKGNQNIICLPHNLIIKGIGTNNSIDNPTIG